MSQVKFYKGMSNADAAEGLKRGGEISADNGGILFSDGEVDPTKSKRIYTKDAGLVTEYYKEDLEFATSKKLAASFGLKNAGDTVSAGTRVMDLLKLVLFVTYAPKYTSPSAKSKDVSVTVTKTSNDEDYIELGGTYKVSNLSITIEKNSVAKAESKLGTTTYSATGGDISSVVFTYKTGVVTNDIAQVGTITKDSAPYSIALTDGTGGLLSSWNATTVDTLGEINTDNILTNVSVTFSAGTSTNGSNKVKDSDGELTNKYSTDNYTTKLENATSDSNIISDNLILERTVDWTISGLSKKLYGYLPIFTSKAIIAKVNGATDNLDTAKSWSANANYADSSNVFTEIDVEDNTTYNKNIVGVSDLYLNETFGSKYYSFKFAQIKRGENQIPKFQFLMPSNLGLSGDFYVKGTDGKLSALAGDIHIVKDSTSEGATYYRNRSDGSFTTTSETNLDTYYLWEILYDLNIQSKGSQDVLVRIIKIGA